MKKYLQKFSSGPMRLLAAAVVSLILVGIVALSTGHMDKGHSREGLYYQVTGLRPDAEVMRINGETITVEEYLYWIATDCNYLVNYGGVTDLNSPLTEEMTYADYIRSDVLVTLRLYGAVRSWAEQNDVSLTETQAAELAAQRSSYIEYYGSEEAYLQQLALLGISEECFDRINATPYLYSSMVEAYADPDNALYPGDEAVRAYAKAQGLMTADVLYLTAEPEWDEDEKQEKEDAFTTYGEKLRTAGARQDSVQEEMVTLLDGVDRQTLTFTLTEGDPIAETAAALEVGQVSDTVKNGDSLYIVIRRETDMTEVCAQYVNTLVEEKRDNAVVVFNEELYNAIDISAFFEALSQAQQSMAGSAATAP